MTEEFQIRRLPDVPDYLAPDLSEIRLLPEFEAGGLSHCTLPPGKISNAVRHRSVEEIWYCISGEGRIWQRNVGWTAEKPFTAGDSFKIAAGNSFQFRNDADEPLCILIATLPKWPGPEEAGPAEGVWDV